MAFDRLSYGGAAVRTTLAGDIGSGDTSLSLTNAAGWPDGTNGPFNLEIVDGSDDTSTLEKIQATARTGNTLTGLSRGVDGSSPLAHSAGARVLHGFHASEADAANLTAHQTLGQVAATGDLLVGDGANALQPLPVSDNGLVLLGDSGQATGLRWGQVSTEGIESNSIFASHLVDGIISQDKLESDLRATWLADDAAGVLALTANTGDLAVQRDLKAVLYFNGTDWQIASRAPQQQTVTGGPTSGTTELVLATLVVPAMVATYQVECAAFWTGFNSVDSDIFAFRVRVDGTQVAGVEGRHVGSINIRLPYSVPTSSLVTIPASTATTITCTVQRTSGTGTLTNDTNGVLTAKFWPA